MPKIESKSKTKPDTCWICDRPIDDEGVSTCIPGIRVHAVCDDKIVRQKERRTKSPVESQHDSIYKKFLAGKIYPEIQCHFTTADGCEVNGHLTDRFFKE